MPLGSALRVGAVVGLCALCYQLGAWRASLETRASFAPLAPLSPRGPVAVSEPAGAVAAPGQPADQPVEVITPLNVRDAADLVMGPGASVPTPASEPPPVPPAMPRRAR